jgi:hypothetical protein
MSNAASTGQDAQHQSKNESATSVDWADLWEEFGFDTPDAAGNKMASRTQLIAALQSTTQDLAGDPLGHINGARAAGKLVERYSGDEALRGYVFVGGDEK